MHLEALVKKKKKQTVNFHCRLFASYMFIRFDF